MGWLRELNQMKEPWALNVVWIAIGAFHAWVFLHPGGMPWQYGIAWLLLIAYHGVLLIRNLRQRSPAPSTLSSSTLSNATSTPS